MSGVRAWPPRAPPGAATLPPPARKAPHPGGHARVTARAADCCDTGGGSSRRTQRVMMWCVAPIALAMVLFPSYVGSLFGSDGLGVDDGSPLVVLQLDGLTCEACTVVARQALGDAPGVRGVEVDYETSTARVAVDEEVSVEELSARVEAAGFQVLASRREPGR